VAAMPKHASERVALDEEGLRALQSLGYVGGAAPNGASEDEEARRDPKDMVHVFRGIARAGELIRLRHHAEAVQLLEPLAAESPESDELHAALAEAYRALNRLPEAERAYRASLRSVPNDPKKLTGLADVLRRQNKVAEAVECLQRAVAASPTYGPPHSLLGTIFFQRRDFARAAQHFRRYLELNPASLNAHANLVAVLLQTGKYQEVIKLERWALERDPAFAPAHQSLWQALNATQQRFEAIDALRAACRALPKDYSFKRHLAALLATTPQLGPPAAREAIALATQCCAAVPDLPESFDVLGMAYAAAGNVTKAVEAARRALALAQAQGNSQLARQIAQRLQTYQTSRP
jgi:tetratricopeptide (TPR) repeat protein